MQITNGGATPLSGFPVACGVGTAGGQLPVANRRAEAVRVCNAKGLEMLFVLRGPGGAAVKQGPIPDGSSWLVPVECPPAAKVVYYVYFDNPQAAQVPDFLVARAGLVNGSISPPPNRRPAQTIPAP